MIYDNNFLRISNCSMELVVKVTKTYSYLENYKVGTLDVVNTI